MTIYSELDLNNANFLEEKKAYQICTQVVLLEEIEDEVAENHKSKCPDVVFDIEDIANGKCDCIYSLRTRQNAVFFF